MRQGLRAVELPTAHWRGCANVHCSVGQGATAERLSSHCSRRCCRTWGAARKPMSLVAHADGTTTQPCSRWAKVRTCVSIQTVREAVPPIPQTRLSDS